LLPKLQQPAAQRMFGNLFFGTMMDCYQTLEVDKDADMAAIRAAYLKRALETHPDKPGGNTDMFQKVVTAFEILSDPAERLKHGIVTYGGTVQLNKWPAAAGTAVACGQGPRVQGAGVAPAAGSACRDRGSCGKRCGLSSAGPFRSSTGLASCRGLRGLQGRLLPR